MSAKPIEDVAEIKLGEDTKRLKLNTRTARDLERLQGVSIFRICSQSWLDDHAGLDFFSNAIYCGLKYSKGSRFKSPDEVLDVMHFTEMEGYITAVTDMFAIYINGGKRPEEEAEPEEALAAKNDVTPAPELSPPGESL